MSKDKDLGVPASPSGASSLRSPEPQDASPPSVTPSIALDETDRKLLSILDDVGGYETRLVAERMPQFGSNGHQHSGAVRSWLMRLRSRGLVEFLDDEKPVCWKRTALGTATLAQGTEARRGETASCGLDAKHDGPVAESDAPKGD